MNIMNIKHLNTHSYRKTGNLNSGYCDAIALYWFTTSPSWALIVTKEAFTISNFCKCVFVGAFNASMQE